MGWLTTCQRVRKELVDTPIRIAKNTERLICKANPIGKFDSRGPKAGTTRMS